VKHIKEIIGEYMESISKKDRCIMCSEKTEYTEHTHIDERQYYVEGAGQMCRGCYTKIY